jgi:hypothetical protein
MKGEQVRILKKKTVAYCSYLLSLLLLLLSLLCNIVNFQIIFLLPITKFSGL